VVRAGGIAAALVVVAQKCSAVFNRVISPERKAKANGERVTYLIRRRSLQQVLVAISQIFAQVFDVGGRELRAVIAKYVS
jgi:hypothetical protein